MVFYHNLYHKTREFYNVKADGRSQSDHIMNCNSLSRFTLFEKYDKVINVYIFYWMTDFTICTYSWNRCWREGIIDSGLYYSFFYFLKFIFNISILKLSKIIKKKIKIKIFFKHKNIHSIKFQLVFSPLIVRQNELKCICLWCGVESYFLGYGCWELNHCHMIFIWYRHKLREYFCVGSHVDNNSSDDWISRRYFFKIYIFFKKLKKK